MPSPIIGLHHVTAILGATLTGERCVSGADWQEV
jgi:hypothetical protein